MPTIIEPKTARINLRTNAQKKEFIAQAAKLKNRSMSDFILENAFKAAEEVLQDQTHYFLNPKEWEAFLKALDTPPKSIPKLKKLFSKKTILES